MLPTDARLRHRRDFTATLRTGRRTTCGTVAVSLARAELNGSARSGRCAGSDEAPAARVGFAVGRVVGGSVTRHLVTRRLRHLMADRLHRLAAGDQVVVRALPAAATSGYRRLERDLDAALSRLLTARR